MIETDLAEAVFGDPFALILARALIGLQGVCLVPPHADVQVVTLTFEHDHVIYANAGGLLLCPASYDLCDTAHTPYMTLTEPNSALLVNAMKVDFAVSGGYQVAA